MSGLITRNLVADKTKTKDGVWIDIGIDFEKEGNPLTRIKMRRIGPSNKEFKKKHAALGKKYSMMRGDKAALQDKALMEAICHTCIVGWENMENINAQVEGEPAKTEYMPFTPDNAIKLFTYSPDTYDLIVTQATELENFQSESNQELGKNLPPTSNIS